MKLGTGYRRFPPGVRFHPTDAELVTCYLLRMVLGLPLEPGFVAEVDVYQFHPADLKPLACFSEELNWYFFCSTGNKYVRGNRKNRSYSSGSGACLKRCGFWKPTGNDRSVVYGGRTVAKVKTLVFHEAKTAKGERTDWTMHEYRLEDGGLGNKDNSAEIVLCKIFKKGGLGPRKGEQFGAVYNEDEWNNALELIEHGQSSVSADVNTTTEQVHSGAVSLSVVHQASTPTSNGGTSDANPFHERTTAMTPVSDYTDMFYPAAFGGKQVVEERTCNNE